jgi:hypothetical protein
MQHLAFDDITWGPFANSRIIQKSQLPYTTKDLRLSPANHRLRTNQLGDSKKHLYHINTYIYIYLLTEYLNINLL